MTLHEECLVALGNSAEIMNDMETKEIFKAMTEIFPITTWGRVDWGKLDRKIKATSIQEVINKLKEEKLTGEYVYILWDEVSLPAVKTKIEKILSIINDVTAVSFDTWVFCPLNQYLIEFYHEDEITLGFGK